MDQSNAPAIKGYELLEHIGEGAYGAVYRARQQIVDRQVAVKIILPEFANQPDFIRRFETEAQLVAQLEHLHIVPLYDYWRDPEGAYLVMRLMKGGNLENLIEKGALSPTQTEHMLEQVGSALISAHRKGIVHRDLKPANILLDEEGNAYLSDFGIAKAIGAQSGLTLTGAIVGTPAYISPEQVQALPVSPQSDIYSLGVVMYEMLSGKPPFPDTNPGDLIARHLRDPLPALELDSSEMAADLDAIIQKATAKQPEKRYPDVGSLLVDFRKILGPELIPTADRTLGEGFLEVSNPYKGLRAFQEADAADFFGRETLIQQLIKRMKEEGDFWRFLAVVGPSGSGKSSVVKAGLLPELRQGAIPGSEEWYIVNITPGSHPLDELEVGLLRVAAEKPANLMEQLQRDKRGLVRASQLILTEGKCELLLVIDQFEETFTLAEDKSEAAQFMDLIVDAVTEPNSQVRVLITIRADFFDRPLMEADFSTLVQQRTEVVVPLSSAELERAITAPAERIGMALEPGLETEIITDVIDQPGSLPLLQYALTELFERREGSLLTRTAYQEIGGVLGALGRQAEQVYQKLGQSSKALSRQIFLRLVTLGEGVEDTRRRVQRSELTSLADHNPSGVEEPGTDQLTKTEFDKVEAKQLPINGSSNGAVNKVIEAFGKARLLSFDHDPASRAPTVEVAHEALLREWVRLKEWLVENRADIRLQRLLSNAAAEWMNADKDPSFLLSGSRLAQFEGWAEHTSLALTEGELLYLQASLLHEAERQAHEAALERRSRNFLRGLVAVFALAAVVAVALSIFALTARNQARSEADARATQQVIAQENALQADQNAATAVAEADARATAEADALEQKNQVLRQAGISLSSQASNQIDLGNPDEAVLLMLAALDEYPYSPNLEKTLAEGVGEIADVQLFPIQGRLGWAAVSWSPKDDRVATAFYGKNAGTDNTILIQDPNTGDNLLEIPLDQQCLGPLNAIWSPSGDRLVVLPQYCNYTPDIWDAQSGELMVSLASQNQPNQAAFSASWSPDGAAILTGSQDGIARIWDAESGRRLAEIPAHDNYITQVAWSPDGEKLATGSADDKVRIWNANSRELLQELSGYSDDISGLSWSPDGELIAAASLDGNAQIWNSETGEITISLEGHQDQIWDIAWSPSGRYIATDSRDGTARVWDAKTGKELYSFRHFRSEEQVLNSIDWSPDGEQLLVMGGVYNQIWDLSKQPPRLLGHEKGLPSASWSPDGSLIATTSIDGSARIWDASSGENLKILSHPGEVEDLAWSPDSSQVVTVDQEGNIRIWEVNSGRSSEIANPEGYRFNSLAWSPDGGKIAASSKSDLEAVIWELESGKTIPLEQGDLTCYLSSPSWSPDGQRLITGCVKTEVKNTPARIWEADTGQEAAQVESRDGNSRAVDWSPDGESIAVAYSEMAIRTYDAETLQPESRYSQHADIIEDLRWSPNSQRIASADGGGFVRIWQADTGEEILSFKTTNTLNSIDWSPDGQYVIAATLDSEPEIKRAWQSKEELIQYAQECCVWRELTLSERQSFGLPLD